VPVRQWVLTLPFDLRFAVAFDRALCRAVRAAFMDGVLGALRRRARRQGVADGRSGAVVCVQRFGGALNLNVHIHALVLDGVYHRESCGERPVFRAARRLEEGDLAEVLQAVIAKVHSVLRRHGLSPGDETGALFDLAERSPALAGVQAGSMAGRRAVRVGRLPGLGFVQPVRPDCVAQDGFTLHAGVSVPGGPAARERLSELDDGRVAYDLRRPWSDGTHRIWLSSKAPPPGPADRLRRIRQSVIRGESPPWRL
jgi:hypothetical protein